MATRRCLIHNETAEDGVFHAGIKLEYNLFIRERNDGLYRVITYLLFKMFTEMIIVFFASLIFSCAVFFPLQFRGQWVYFWVNYLATLTTGIRERPLALSPVWL